MNAMRESDAGSSANAYEGCNCGGNTVFERRERPHSLPQVSSSSSTPTSTSQGLNPFAGPNRVSSHQHVAQSPCPERTAPGCRGGATRRCPGQLGVGCVPTAPPL